MQNTVKKTNENILTYDEIIDLVKKELKVMKFSLFQSWCRFENEKEELVFVDGPQKGDLYFFIDWTGPNGYKLVKIVDLR